LIKRCKTQIFINKCKINLLLKKMANRCVYCKCELNANKALSVCKSCGVKVWGLKMYEAIDSQMNDAKETGNLEQGSIV
jgi:Zn finger protein HypA/HybF involved in hydrogenase expression